MSSQPAQIEFRRFRAPREDRAAVIEPPLAAVDRLVEQNLRRREEYNYDVQGRPLTRLAEHARRELLAGARRWTESYRSVDAAAFDPATPLVLAGHQPELFHPGVWLKNFVLGAAARECGAVAVNLIVDSDTPKSTSLRVPDGSIDRPRTEIVPLDKPGVRLPYEEQPVVDRAAFADFGRRAAQAIAPLVPRPLLERYWPMVLDRLGQTDNRGACLAQARHQLEGQWGLETLEIPQSWVCGSQSFCWLVAHLLAQLPRFREVYNEAVHEYRAAHRIRNAAHPVPDLAADGPWIEAPLWVWSTGSPERRRLFARQSGSEVVLSDRGAVEVRLTLTPDGDAARAVERLAELPARGIKIRSRALVTTLWARLALGDLFLHGIGGAKYDQVNDLVIERFFGLPPPAIMVVSATLYLPVPRPAATAEQARQIAHELRELTFHPERHVAPGEAQDLVSAKARWIATPRTRENAHARWRAFRQVNEAMQPFVAARRGRLRERQKRLAELLRAQSVLQWREYAFCLYPESLLQEFLAALLPKTA